MPADGRWDLTRRLTLILLTWRIWRAPNNASRWQMGFNWVFTGLKEMLLTCTACVESPDPRDCGHGQTCTIGHVKNMSLYHSAMWFSFLPNNGHYLLGVWVIKSLQSILCTAVTA
jgi:hypothetical protein